MGMTMAEKILSRAAGREARAGDTVVAKVDRLMGHEGFRLAGMVLEEAGIERLWDPDRIVIVLDHAVPAPDEASAQGHAVIRKQVEKYGIQTFYDTRGGISHQVMCEKGHVAPGELILGTDSHSTMYGALGAAGTGIGFTETAYVCATGTLWFTVPETIVVEFEPERAKRSLPKLLRTAADRRRAHALLEWTEQQTGLEDRQRKLAAELRAMLPVAVGRGNAAVTGNGRRKARARA